MIISKYTKENRLDTFLFCMLIILFSLQNKTTLNLTIINLGIIKLNIFDGGIAFAIIVLLFRFLYIKKVGVSIIEWALAFLFIIFLFIGIINGNSIDNIMYNARAFFYLIAGFFLLRTFRGNKDFYFKLLGISSLLCSIIYLYTYYSTYIIYGAQRFVDFNFSIILLFIAFSIYYFREKEVSFFSVLTIILGSWAIISSQTRTFLVPLIILLSILVVYNLFTRKSSSIVKAVSIIFVFIAVYILLFTTIADDAINRLQGLSANQESTLDLRINSVIYNYETMSNAEKILGGGFGREVLYFANFGYELEDAYNLEMYVGEIILKYGFFGFIILNTIFTYILFVKRKIAPKVLVSGIIIILLSLTISGLAGYTGFLFLGVTLGLISNNFLWFPDDIATDIKT